MKKRHIFWGVGLSACALGASALSLGPSRGTVVLGGIFEDSDKNDEAKVPALGDVPVLGWLFRLAKAIPIAPQREDPQAYEAAFERAAQVLREGDLLAIFPEGGITSDGQLQPFKGGIMKILDHARDDGLQVPVIPMALTNLWGSYFSRIELRGGRNVAMVKPLRRGLFNRVGLEVGEPVAAAAVTPASLAWPVDSSRSRAQMATTAAASTSPRP